MFTVLYFKYMNSKNALFFWLTEKNDNFAGNTQTIKVEELLEFFMVNQNIDFK